MINPKTAQSENVSLRRVLEHIVCVLISERLILHDCIPNNAPWRLHQIGEVTYHFKTKRPVLFQRLHPAGTRQILCFYCSDV